MKRPISITLWTCSNIKDIKNDVPSGSSTVEDIIFHFIHVEFLTESSTEYHSVGLCYVGGMKWSMAENNGFCVYKE